MSIMAHAATRPRKVKGIRCDSLQQHIIAPFSDSPGEPIKIWDLRKAGVTAKPKLMIVQSQVAAVIDVAWSAARAGRNRFNDVAFVKINRFIVFCKVVISVLRGRGGMEGGREGGAL